MKDYNSFAHTSIGFSHISSKKPCQDYSTAYENDVASVIIVSDGHGSSNFTRSDRGSKFACEATQEAVDEFLQNVDLNVLGDSASRDSIVLQLCKNILLRWNTKVDADAAKEPFTEQEVAKVSDKYKQRYLDGWSVEHAYGCTLIVVIMTKDFCLAIRNGDGECVSVDRAGCFDKPIPWNNNCEFNVVTSLCDADAISDFRYSYSTTLPAAVFIGSDGVDDSYTSAEELYNLYRHVCLKALDHGIDAASDHVKELLPILTERGSTDDVSIAALIDPVLLAEARTGIENALERHRMMLEEARREHQKRVIIKDIRVAVKKKDKAIAQQQEIRARLNGAKNSHASFLEQINIFRRQAEACNESMNLLVQEDKQLIDIIHGADSEIARLKAELLALEGQAVTSDMADPKVSLSVEPTDVTVTKNDGLSGCDEAATARPETVGQTVAQAAETGDVSPETATKEATDDTGVPE